MKHVIIGFFVILLAESGRLEAHAFLKDAHPAVGSTEPILSRIQVFDASGKEVDKRDVHLDHFDGALLHVSLQRLGAGTYKVLWRVVSIDTHVTNGDFTFRVAR